MKRYLSSQHSRLRIFTLLIILSMLFGVVSPGAVRPAYALDAPVPLLPVDGTETTIHNYPPLGIPTVTWAPVEGAPTFGTMALPLLLPVFLIWGAASILWRSQELRILSRSLDSVVAHLTEPESVAVDSVVSVSQAIRREIDFTVVTCIAPGEMAMRLQDPEQTKVVIVTLAETTPVLEAEGLHVLWRYVALGRALGLTVDGLGRVEVCVHPQDEALARAILEPGVDAPEEA